MSVGIVDYHPDARPHRQWERAGSSFVLLGFFTNPMLSEPGVEISPQIPHRSSDLNKRRAGCSIFPLAVHSGLAEERNRKSNIISGFLFVQGVSELLFHRLLLVNAMIHGGTWSIIEKSRGLVRL